MTKQVETKETEPTITAANCPEKASHQTRLNQTCQACGEVIPGHGYYTGEEFLKYFAPSGYGQSVPHPIFETPRMLELKERDRVLWEEYDRVRMAHEAAVFEVEDLKRGRRGARGKDADPALGAGFDAQIAAGNERKQKLYEGMQAIQEEIRKLSLVRKGIHQRALWEESYPADATPGSIAARIAAVIRGATT